MKWKWNRHLALTTWSITVFGISLHTHAAVPKEKSLKAKDGTLIKVENIVSGLKHPWALAFLPDNRLLVTERNTGNLYILGTDKTLSKPLKGVPEVKAQGQGGLMDVAIDPQFQENSLIYLAYAKPGKDGKATTALGRGKLSATGIEGFKDIFVQEPYVDGANHFGNRIAFSPDGKHLFLALGERFKFAPAQDLSSHLGKVIRIFPDGTVPKDNPFVGKDKAADEVWSYGHRNIEAMDFQPGTDALWVVEMGPLGGDELNKVEKAANYGWPIVSWGDNYDGTQIPDPPTNPKFQDAAFQWTPVISPSGMDFYSGKMFPNWKNNAFVGGLSSQAVVRLAFDGAKYKEYEILPMQARIRDVVEAPDGSIYVLSDDSDGGVLRLSKLEKHREKIKKGDLTISLPLLILKN